MGWRCRVRWREEASEVLPDPGGGGRIGSAGLGPVWRLPSLRLDLPRMDLPGVPSELLQRIAAAAGTAPIALVGGAVRDLLLHRVHQDPWRGLPDLDLVVQGAPGAEGSAEAPAAVQLARTLEDQADGCLLACREHGAYGTVEQAFGAGGRFCLNVATARQERYPVAAANPVVRFGNLHDDLARRDFIVNAMALRLAPGGSAATQPDLL